MASSYKASKEAFVSGMTGSSISHINFVSAAALSSIALYSALQSRLPITKSLAFPAQWLLLIGPLLLSITIFANAPEILISILLFLTALLMLIPRSEKGTPLPSNSSSSPTKPLSPMPHSMPKNIMQHLPALTTYRSHMLLMTMLSILAVDFPVFPRSLAKCETYGVSLMDLGVGSFVFSQGIVSAIPIVKNPSHLSAPVAPKVIQVLRKCSPLLCLGLLRVFLVKGVEYPEHETEYGTHWNFFFTLALLPLLQVLLHPFFMQIPVFMMGALIAVSHQIALSFFGMREFALFAPRTNLITTNKEGIVSLTGYLSIHLFGLATGTMLLPPSPSYFRRQLQLVNSPHREGNDASVPSHPKLGAPRENDKTAIELCSYAIIWWAFLGLTFFLDVDSGVSRRLSNLPYILWVSAFNASSILGYLLLDLYFWPSPLSKSVYSPTSKLKVHADSSKFPLEMEQAYSPALLEAINHNGLSVFLLANVATGLVNMTFSTMYMSNRWAMAILSAYGFGVCLVAWILKDNLIWRLKFL